MPFDNFGSNEYCGRYFNQLTDRRRWSYLVRQNAYFIWERSVRAGQEKPALENWIAAETYVAQFYKVWFKPGYLASLNLPHVTAVLTA